MTEDFDGFGYDPEEDEPIPTWQPPYVDALPPSYEVTSAYLPPVGEQGTAANPGAPASCTAWASTYGLATFTAAKAGLVNPSEASGQASPAFIYIKVRQQGGANSGPCLGSKFQPYFDMLAANGTPNMATAPYYADCDKLWQKYASSNPQSTAAFKMGPVVSVDVSGDLKHLKRVLASNRALAYGTRLYKDWVHYRGKQVPYVGGGPFKRNKDGKLSGHCMLIIGYNENCGPNGAIKIQNSQGTGWGSAGYVWMDCDTFQKLAQGKAFHVKD
jgi:hypothetical protein